MTRDSKDLQGTPWKEIKLKWNRQNDDAVKHHFNLTTLLMRRNVRANEEMNLQAAHLPRKAPKDTLPMPVANIQKQKKCSRNRVSAVQSLAVGRKNRRRQARDKERKKGGWSNKSTKAQSWRLNRCTTLECQVEFHQRLTAFKLSVCSILDWTNKTKNVLDCTQSSLVFQATWEKVRAPCCTEVELKWSTPWIVSILFAYLL